ncbi:MAG TPA: YgaP-like transmembrane domain [Verrucomicrobiae bacterium]|nr:YgaP-like transmembrane domain [Verrucomicrobiae bacterium]
MNRFLKRNLDHRGRMARGVMGTLMLIAGIVVVDYVFWLGIVFVAAGLFALFEAIRGWCLMRACGIRTKL